jgi:hypothetical protein
MWGILFSPANPVRRKNMSASSKKAKQPKIKSGIGHPRVTKTQLADGARVPKKYELLRKALRADGLEVDEYWDDDLAYLDAVLGFADTILNIRSFCHS